MKRSVIISSIATLSSLLLGSCSQGASTPSTTPTDTNASTSVTKASTVSVQNMKTPDTTTRAS